MMIPFPEQQIEIDKILSYIKSGNKKKAPIFVYPTSFGKSVVIANVALQLEDYYFINTAPSKELVEQNYLKYISYGYEASICSASLGSREVSKVTFATIGTLKNYSEFYKNKKVVIFVDECHEASKKDSLLDKFVKKLKNITLLGTTATPINREQTLEGSRLAIMSRSRKSIFKDIASVVQIQELVKKGRWTPLEYRDRGYDSSNLELNTTNTDFTEESVVNNYFETDMGSRISDEVEQLRKEGKKSILVFLTSKREIDDLRERIPNCVYVYSGMSDKERNENIRRFKSGEIDVMLQCNILTTGFDFPALEAIIHARPTHSLTIWYQGVGRLVRVFKGKLVGIVVDLSGNYEKFGRIEDITFEDNVYTNGWACFSKDVLITGFFLGYDFPVREDLIKSYKEAIATKKRLETEPVIFTFGKYKDLTVYQVNNKDRNYLLWLIKNKDFNWYGDVMKRIKKEIEKVLKNPNVLK